MTFNFNPPNNNQPTPQPATPAANPFAPPPQASAPNPMSAAQALAGFGEGAIDSRHPFLPVGFRGELELVSTVGRDLRDVGFAYMIEGKVLRMMHPGGGPAAEAMATQCKLKNPNLIPAREGSIYTVRISGFKSDDARKFAISDTKLFLCAIMEEDGLRPDVQISPEQWNAMALAMKDGTLGRAGRRYLVDAGAVPSKGAFGKVKYTFYPPSAAGG